MKYRLLMPFLLLTLMSSIRETAFGQVPAKEAHEIALEAYVYGYSLLTTEVTRVQMTNVSKPEALRGPMGQFTNVHRYPPADYRGVSAPNADTLYSVCWLDLSEPMVFTHPDMGERFYLFEIVDLWMIVDPNCPSSRVAGQKAATYLFTGPGWKGAVPEGMKQISVATRYVGILGRTYADGTEQDYQVVNGLQAQYKITPLSQWGKKYEYKAPPVNDNVGYSMTDKPQTVILDMGTEGYFNRLAQLMAKSAPPTAEDAPIVARMAKIGLVPGQPFKMSSLEPAVQQALKDLPQTALKKIEANKGSIGVLANGWIITKGLGGYGTDYMKRAVVAAFGWPANREKDAVYPNTDVDSEGRKLTGAHKYTVTFVKAQTPPVNAFWSFTMYEIDQGWWFVPNPLNRFTVSPRNNPKPNADGSLTLYFQHDSPGKDKESNWLPAPKGDFVLMMRMYWPKDQTPSILNGTWNPPSVIRTGE